MYAYITLKFEILPEHEEASHTAQNVAEEYAHYAHDCSEADEIVKIEVKDD